jgi:hypothetical protein
MSFPALIEIEMPDDLPLFRLPDGVQERLNTLLDKQDVGQTLMDSERREAEGLVNLADLLSPAPSSRADEWSGQLAHRKRPSLHDAASNRTRSRTFPTRPPHALRNTRLPLIS